MSESTKQVEILMKVVKQEMKYDLLPDIPVRNDEEVDLSPAIREWLKERLSPSNATAETRMVMAWIRN